MDLAVLAGTAPDSCFPVTDYFADPGEALTWHHTVSAHLAEFLGVKADDPKLTHLVYVYAAVAALCGTPVAECADVCFEQIPLVYGNG